MRLAVFDLDHTLMLNPFWPAVFPYVSKAIAAEAFSPTSPDAVLDEILALAHDLQTRRDLRAGDWDYVVGEVAAQHKISWSEPISTIVERNCHTARLVDGALRMLQRLQEQGWTLGIATQGCRRYQQPVLEHLGLADYFQLAIYADEAGTLKRDRRFYQALPTQAERIVVIGDQFVDDALYPKQFGFTSVWFTGVHRVDTLACVVRPDFELANLSEIPVVMEQVLQESRYQFVDPLVNAASQCLQCHGPSETPEQCEVCRCVNKLKAA